VDKFFQSQFWFLRKLKFSGELVSDFRSDAIYLSENKNGRMDVFEGSNNMRMGAMVNKEIVEFI